MTLSVLPTESQGTTTIIIEFLVSLYLLSRLYSTSPSGAVTTHGGFRAPALISVEISSSSDPYDLWSVRERLGRLVRCLHYLHYPFSMYNSHRFPHMRAPTVHPHIPQPQALPSSMSSSPQQRHPGRLSIDDLLIPKRRASGTRGLRRLENLSHCF
jgi:hypothetical protein